MCRKNSRYSGTPIGGQQTVMIVTDRHRCWLLTPHERMQDVCPHTVAGSTAMEIIFPIWIIGTHNLVKDQTGGDMSGKLNLCPVCGYSLDIPAWMNGYPSEEICPSCGIQFGYDDAAGGEESRRLEIYRYWRTKWIENGMRWYSSQPQPAHWNPSKQLSCITKRFYHL